MDLKITLNAMSGSQCNSADKVELQATNDGGVKFSYSCYADGEYRSNELVLDRKELACALRCFDGVSE